MSYTILTQYRPIPGSSTVAQSNDGSCAERHSLPRARTAHPTGETGSGIHQAEGHSSLPPPLSHPAPGKNKIIPSRNGNAANNCIPMCQPIKNEVAQHFENTIFSLMNIRQEIKKSEWRSQRRKSNSIRWVLS
mgnify:CR=1 FL=1